MAKRLYFTDASQFRSTTFGYVCMTGKIKIKDGAVFAGDNQLSINRAEGLGIDEALKAIKKNEEQVNDEITNYIITDSNEAYIQIGTFINIKTGNKVYDLEKLDNFYEPIAERILELVKIGHKIKFVVIKSHANLTEQEFWIKRYGFDVPKSLIPYLNYGNAVIDTMVHEASLYELAEPPKDINTYVRVDKAFFMSNNVKRTFSELNNTREFYKDTLN